MRLSAVLVACLLITTLFCAVSAADEGWMSVSPDERFGIDIPEDWKADIITSNDQITNQVIYVFSPEEEGDYAVTVVAVDTQGLFSETNLNELTGIFMNGWGYSRLPDTEPSYAVLENYTTENSVWFAPDGRIAFSTAITTPENYFLIAPIFMDAESLEANKEDASKMILSFRM